MQRLLGALIDRPLINNLILILVLVLAFFAADRVRRLGLPAVDLAGMNIITKYPGAAPEDVALNVTTRLEEQLEEVAGLESFRSESLENLSIIKIQIDRDTGDVEEVKDDIRRAIENATDLPAEVEKSEFREVVSDSIPIYVLGLSYAPEELAADPRKALRMEYHARQLRKQLLSLPSVAAVREFGVPDREFVVRADRAKLRSYIVSLDELSGAIARSELRLGGGTLESFTSERAVVTFSEFSNPRELEEIVIRSNDVGSLVRVGDVATVTEELEELDTRTHVNGRPGMLLKIEKKSHYDVIDAVAEIEVALEAYRARAGDDVPRIDVLSDESIETELRLGIVLENAVTGLLLVVGLLFFFFNRQVAFWTALGIPIAIAATLIAFPLLDITINRISLLGMIVTLGMLVDDAVIVAEVIYRLREQGMAAREAAIEGVRTVILPVSITIVTTILAFVPVWFVPFPTGAFAAEIPTICILMLLASLFESMTILPAHLAHTTGEIKPGPGQRLIARLEGVYSRALGACLARPGRTLAAFGAVLLVALAIGGSFSRFKEFPVDQAYRFWIYAETSPDSSLENTERAALVLDRMVAGLPEHELRSHTLTVGRTYSTPFPPSSSVYSNVFIIEMILTPAVERDRSAEEIKDDLFAQYAESGRTEISKLDFYLDGGGPPAGKPVEIRVQAEDPELRRKAAAHVAAELPGLGVTEVSSNDRPGKEEWRLKPDYAAIARTELTVAQVGATIRTAYDGEVAGYYDQGDERIAYRVVLADPDRDFEGPLQGLQARNARGNLIAIESLVTRERGRAPRTVFHYNGIPAYTVTGNIDERTDSPAAAFGRLEQHFADFGGQFPGAQLILAGEAERSSKTFNDLGAAIALTTIAITFLLMIQFNSLTQPLLVMLAIPFGLAGILISFLLHGMDLSINAMIGILGFTGVVINSSLIMVEFINREARVHGRTPTVDEIIAGARTRLRPILVTTITTVSGFLPTAYGLFGGLDSFVSPLVMAMLWGLVTGTAALLFVVPSAYLLNERARLPDLAALSARMEALLPPRARLHSVLAGVISPSRSRKDGA